jgi:hypothetical protein
MPANLSPEYKKAEIPVLEFRAGVLRRRGNCKLAR